MFRFFESHLIDAYRSSSSLRDRRKKMVSYTVAIAKWAVLGDSLGDESCPPFIQCPTTGTESFMMVPRVESTYIHVDHTVSRAGNSNGQKIKNCFIPILRTCVTTTKKINYCKPHHLTWQVSIFGIFLVLSVVVCGGRDSGIFRDVWKRFRLKRNVY